MATRKTSVHEREKLLSKAVESARKVYEKSDLERLEAFIPVYFEGVSVEDMREHRPDQMAGAALAHLTLAEGRKREGIAVDVFNPRRRNNRWSSLHTIIQVVAPDMPFLVDSLSMVARRAGLSIHQTVHPVLSVQRDKKGHIEAIDTRGNVGDSHNESFILLEVDRVPTAEKLKALADDVKGALSDVSAAANDWTAMRNRAEEIAYKMNPEDLPLDPEELEETRLFLHWLVDNHFTFLGYREYDLHIEGQKYTLRQKSETGMGILRQKQDKQSHGLVIPRELRKRALAREPIIVTKANSRSTVHRDAFFDYVGLKKFNEEGEVCGEYRFLGLFTSSVYANSPREIPIVRSKIRHVLERSRLSPVSHAGKGLINAMETLPRDELFQANDDELFTIALGIIQIQERQQVRLFIRRDAFGRFYSCLIFIPRERYSSTVRERMQSILGEALGAREIETYVQMGESRLARVHIVVHTAPWQRARIGHKRLERELSEASRTWDDRLHEALVRRYGEERGTPLADHWYKCFPLSYQEDVEPEGALKDIRYLRRLSDKQPLEVRLYRQKDDPEDDVHLRVFSHEQPVIVSDILPLLENMGLKIIAERPYELKLEDDSIYWMSDFEALLQGDSRQKLDKVAPRFRETFLSVWSGKSENDKINTLVLAAGLNWRQIRVIRAYAKYLLQTGMPFGTAYVESIIASRPKVAHAILGLFEARFDPELSEKDRTQRVKKADAALDATLEKINGQDEDRILRGLAALVHASLRTNHFCTGRRGHNLHYLSFKLDSAKVPELPLPKPMFEIFVYAPHVQGIHLRGGKVARGGIRWSDRKADYRTEVLGLMKAQMVKNTVIVPVGSKGGFIANQLPEKGGRDEVLTEVKRCYRDYIRGLLDLTDNIVNAEVVHPDNVVRYDEDDTYMVVAADKGTATFSDLANQIAIDYNYWLGDAFASGGSAGYDHKGMGITAKGAWESVKRLFREQHVNPETESVTAVGIGDMAGDVFGNGMLLSKKLKLCAAFNHMHIFIDPDPDPKKAYAERERLFNLPRSAWSDYDESKISKGGGVYERSAKSIKLGKEARDMLGIESDKLTPQQLIQAVLKAPVDLLWNGGIGTYVKSSRESDSEVGDRANDAVRIDGRDLRCRIVGEGGNLGFTQRGRIEYALKGGHITTDFIDNSAGVDCSDHEVNIKILLNVVREHKKMTEKNRRKLLKDMTGDVENLVLRDNYLQSLALSTAESEASNRLNEHAHLLRNLERDGHLNRQIEMLPSDEEIAERRVAKQGLTRPELAIVFAYSKIAMFNTLDDNSLAEDPYLRGELSDYFPELLRERYESSMPSHPLQAAIIATAITNSMINRMGPNFPSRVQEETGADINTVARAYTMARESLDMLAIWRGLEKLDATLPSPVQTSVISSTCNLIRHATRWILEHGYGGSDISKKVDSLGAAVQALLENVPAILPEYLKTLYHDTYQKHIDLGLDKALASRVAALPALYPAFDIAEVSARTNLEVAQAGEAYFLLSSHLELDWLHRQVELLPSDDHWKALARATLREGLYAEQRRLTIEALKSKRKGKASASELVETWLENEAEAVEHFRAVVAEIKTLEQVEFASMSVVLRKIGAMSAPKAGSKSASH
jgi:glutamate dehydrogenase